MWLKFHFHYELNHPLDFNKHLNGRFIYSKGQLLKQTQVYFLQSLDWNGVSTWYRLSIQIIHPKLKLKEKTQWWINNHFIDIDNSFERWLSSQREEKKISIKIDDLDLVLWWFDWIPQFEKNESDEKDEIHQLKNSIQHKQTFIQNNQIEKNQLFSIEFIHSQIVVFIIFINLKQKYDEIHCIDYFWAILVKKRNFCLFNCFLGWRKERKWKVFLCFSNCFFGYKTFFFVDQKFQNPRLRIP